MQKEITAPQPLLDSRGNIINEGWARKPFWNYERKAVRRPWYRIKEWDYYYILDAENGRGVTLTMSDLGYAGLFAVCWLDFKTQTSVQADTLRLLSRHKTGFTGQSDRGRLQFGDKKMRLDFQTDGDDRILKWEVPNFDGGTPFSGLLHLSRSPRQESMVIATSWEENRRAFYYNEKINCLKAQGTVTLGEESFAFSPEKAFGGLDWGRGSWTYKNRWFWGSASGLLEGIPFGWNIGYGFSDRTPATENMVFYNGRAHKLEEVQFNIDPEDYMKPWTFTSSDGRFEMDFQPLIDRKSHFNVGLIESRQDQVFGTFTGKVILDDGKELAVKDFLGFAEDVFNRW